MKFSTVCSGTPIFSPTVLKNSAVCFAPTGTFGNLINGVPYFSSNFSTALTPNQGFTTILYSAWGIWLIWSKPFFSEKIMLALIPIDPNKFLIVNKSPFQ